MLCLTQTLGDIEDGFPFNVRTKNSISFINSGRNTPTNSSMKYCSLLKKHNRKLQSQPYPRKTLSRIIFLSMEINCMRVKFEITTKYILIWIYL